MSTRLARRQVPKAANYTIVYPMDAAGTTFTNRGATGTIVLTLPAPSAALLGVWYEALGVADFTFGFATPAAGQMLSKANPAAQSIAATVDKLGNRLYVECVSPAPGTYAWAATGIAATCAFFIA